MSSSISSAAVLSTFALLATLGCAAKSGTDASLRRDSGIADGGGDAWVADGSRGDASVSDGGGDSGLVTDAGSAGDGGPVTDAGSDHRCSAFTPTTLTYPEPTAVHWVSETGSANWVDSASTVPLGGVAASSLAVANASVRAGDLVFLRGGAYGRAIAPASSGEDGSPIVYRAYEEESVVFDGLRNCVEASEVSHVIVEGISCFRTSGAWVDFAGGSYNEIWNSEFETAMNSGGIVVRGHHHRVVGNTLRSTCTRTTNCPGNPGDPSRGSCLDTGGPSDLIGARGDHILLEANELHGGFHYAISNKGSYNVIRGNLFHNRLHGNLGRGAGKHSNVIENNRFFESGTDRSINFCGQGRDRDMPMNKQNQYGSSDTQNTIVRGNIFVGGGVTGSSNWRADILNQHVYGNTFYRNHVNYQMMGSSPDYRFDGEVFVNNILARASEQELNTTGPASSGNLICSNNIWNIEGGTVSIGTNDTCGGSNLNVDPGFVSEAERAIDSDLRLMSTSSMVDAGRWLTTVTSPSGSGATFRVSDARFFTDGNDLIPGDAIQLEGDTRLVRVLSIDYESGALVVDESISWTLGQGVSLPYVGAAPDLGAYERCE